MVNPFFSAPMIVISTIKSWHSIDIQYPFRFFWSLKFHLKKKEKKEKRKIVAGWLRRRKLVPLQQSWENVSRLSLSPQQFLGTVDFSKWSETSKHDLDAEFWSSKAMLCSGIYLLFVLSTVFSVTGLKFSAAASDESASLCITHAAASVPISLISIPQNVRTLIHRASELNISSIHSFPCLFWFILQPFCYFLCHCWTSAHLGRCHLIFLVHRTAGTLLVWPVWTHSLALSQSWGWGFGRGRLLMY